MDQDFCLSVGLLIVLMLVDSDSKWKKKKQIIKNEWKHRFYNLAGKRKWKRDQEHEVPQKTGKTEVKKVIVKGGKGKKVKERD